MAASGFSARRGQPSLQCDSASLAIAKADLKNQALVALRNFDAFWLWVDFR
jgi:hypothetical protein